MNTTSLFVELIVVGLHATIWVGLLGLATFGYRLDELDRMLSLNLAVPVLALSYVLGIVVDKLADLLVIARDQRIRKQYAAPDEPSFLDMRFAILSRSDAVYQQLEYIRSRMRIARAAILNWGLTTLALLIVLWVHPGVALSADRRAGATFVIALLGLFLVALSYHSWTALTRTYIRSTKSAYRVLHPDDEKQQAPPKPS